MGGTHVLRGYINIFQHQYTGMNQSKLILVLQKEQVSGDPSFVLKLLLLLNCGHVQGPPGEEWEADHSGVLEQQLCIKNEFQYFNNWHGRTSTQGLVGGVFRQIFSRPFHALIIFEFYLILGPLPPSHAWALQGRSLPRDLSRDPSLYLEMLGCTWTSSKLLESSGIQRSPGSR